MGRKSKQEKELLELAEIAREMGLKRFSRFANWAEQRLVESVKDCGEDKPRSKAETARAAVDGYAKLAGVSKILLDGKLNAIRVSELLRGGKSDSAEDRAPVVVEFVLEPQGD